MPASWGLKLSAGEEALSQGHGKGVGESAVAGAAASRSGVRRGMCPET